MLCPNCGEEFDYEDNYCPYCGTKSIVQLCTMCGSEYINEEFHFCPHCGKKLVYRTDIFETNPDFYNPHD